VGAGQNVNGVHFGSFPTIIEDTVGTNDSYFVRLSPTAPKVQIFINSSTDQTPIYTINASLLASLTIKSGAGNDVLSVDFSNGNPIPAGGIVYDGGSNSGTPGDSLEVIGASGLSASYLPSGSVAGSGTFSVGTSNISFAGLEPVTASEFDSLTVITPNGNDTIEIDSPAAGQNRIGGLSGGMAFESLSFLDVASVLIDTATNDGAGGNDAVHIGGAGMVASGLGTLSLNVGLGANFVLIDGGSVQLDTTAGVGGTLSMIARNDAVINLPTSQRFAAVTLGESARLNLIAIGTQVLSVNSLSLDPDAVVDLGTHSMIVQSTAADRATALANIRSLIRSGRHGGAWNGSGIISTAAASDTTGNTGLAAIINDRGDGTTVRSELGGMTVDANCILIKWTYNGDGDLNGMLNADDYALIDSAAGAGGATDYYHGDFDYSDTTNPDDYFFIDKAYSGQAGTLSDGPTPLAAESQTATRHAPRPHHHHRRATRESGAKERAWLMLRHAR
jgi:hypothetical protein